MSESTRRITLAVCVCLMPIMATAAQAAALIADTFTLNSADREVGDPLHGVAAEIGNLAWKSTDGTNPRWKYAAGGTVSVAGSTGEQYASTVKYSPTFAGDILSVSVDVDYGGYTGNTGYTMVGFNRDDQLSSRVTYYWSVYLQVRGDGSWMLRNADVGTYLASGTGLTTTGGFHSLKVTYDTINKTTSAWYDGNLLAADKTVTKNPAVAYAGFGAAKITNIVQADNFVLAAVPEPATLALLALGGLLITRRRQA